MTADARLALAATLAVASQARRSPGVEWCLCRTDSIGGHLRIVDKCIATSEAEAAWTFRRGLYKGYPKHWQIVSTLALRTMRRFV